MTNESTVRGAAILQEGETLPDGFSLVKELGPAPSAVSAYSLLKGSHPSHWPNCAAIISPKFDPCDCDRGTITYYGGKAAPVFIVAAAKRTTPDRPWSTPDGVLTEDQRTDARRIKLLGVAN